MTAGDGRIRRIGSRRVVLGAAPSPEDAARRRALSARDRTLEGDEHTAAPVDRADAWDDRERIRDEERWLREQRPPHWG